MKIQNELTPAFDRIANNVLLKANAKSGLFFDGTDASLAALIEEEASEVIKRLPKEEMYPLARVYSQVFTERPVKEKTQTEVALDAAKKDLVVAVHEEVAVDLLPLAA